MIPKLQAIVDQVELVLKTAPCEKYSKIDRLGILKYRQTTTISPNSPISPLIKLALQAHGRATRSPFTRLDKPIFVFCPDNLKNTCFEHNLDLNISIRLKLGYNIETYEELVRWYISFS